MVELSEKLSFALEAREAFLVLRELLRQDLDRDLALQLRVGGAIHLTHAAFTQLGGDLGWVDLGNVRRLVAGRDQWPGR